MAIPVIMPRQGQSVETCIITQWHRSKGDTVKTGDILFSYETDKASFDVEAQHNGILLEVFFGDGDEVPVLTNVAVIGQSGENAEAFRPAGAGHTHSPVPSVRISPRARTMADKMGINTATLAGSGPNGRIIAIDIEAAAAVHSHELSGQSHGPDDQMEYVDKKLSNIRKITARAMLNSISTSAQLTHHLSADVRKLLALRATVKTNLEKGGKDNITLNDMICFAAIKALEKFPEVNSHFLDNTIRSFKKIHLGLAVDTPRGLMVPSIQHAGSLSLKELSERIREVADQCRKGNVNPGLLSASVASFTISNLGNYGVEMFTPIINLPQVAILGVNTILYRPADLGDNVFGFVPVIGLSLTYDHRAIDGGPATQFLKEIKNQIEHFEESI